MTDEIKNNETQGNTAVEASAAVEVAELKIEIDRKKITLGDMLFIVTMQDRSERKLDPEPHSTLYMLQMLQRVIVGGIDNIPFDALEDVMKAIGETLSNSPKVKN